MKQYKFIMTKKHKKTMISAGLSAFCFSFNISLLTATLRISSIKAGEYPEQPIDIRNQLLNEAMPNIIITSIILGLLILIFVFIISLLIKFRLEYNVYLFHELKLYLIEKRNKLS